MKATIRAVVALVALSSVAFAAGYDSQGFEFFSLGALNGQDGWTAGQSGSGAAPAVVTAPHPVLGQQAVKLEVADVQGDTSWMEHGFVPADLIAAGYTNLVVSYDIHRHDGPKQNMWWWLWDAGEPTYGLQWDIGGTLPHGWNPGAGSATTVTGRYANVTMEWDLVTMKAYSWYDGSVVDNGIPITNLTSLTGWAIWLTHDAGNGSGGDVAYIDNFAAVATPEPASLLLALLGTLLRRR